jgi:tetratricopeptide (TPR) repeat protein
VHWGRRAAASFPQGQLYANLRGFDPSGAPARPDVVVRGFLDALGVPGARVPAEPDAQFALYRSLLAGRRMLIVLDNARDAGQVRILLPGAAGCVVLVTSRNRLDGLVALEGARLVTLDPLSPAEARGLLDRRLGAGRAAAEPDAVEELAGLCARLPLALNIAAAHAAVHPALPLTALTGHLRETPSPLAALDTGDAAANVRAVFSWSYRALGGSAARMFRLLSLNPGPDISAGTAASLTATDSEHALAALDELAAAHLLAEPAPGRYAFHDLLRAYAAELTDATDNDDERHAATHRLLDHYLHTANTAAVLLYPARDRIDPPPARPGTTPEELTDDQQAWNWLDAERPALLAAIELAALRGFDTHAHLLPWTLVTFLDRRGHWHDYVATQNIALGAVQRLGDEPGQARVHRTLGRAYMRLGSYPDVHVHLRHALRLSRQLGDQVGEAYNHRIIAWAHDQQGRYREALGHVQRALELFRATGHEVGQAQTLNAVGWYHSLLGEHESALAPCQEALELHHKRGDEIDEAGVWDSLGHAHHHLGDHRKAVSCFHSALGLFRKTGERYEQANTLTRLGETHRAAGDREAARDAWQEALTILRDLEHPDAEQVGAKLRELTSERRPAQAADGAHG